MWRNPALCCINRYIDESHNPELFTCHQLEQSLADYRAVQKKVQAYKVCPIIKGWLGHPKLFIITISMREGGISEPSISNQEGLVILAIPLLRIGRNGLTSCSRTAFNAQIPHCNR